MARGASPAVATALFLSVRALRQVDLHEQRELLVLALGEQPDRPADLTPSESLPPPVEVTVTPAGSVSQTFTPWAVALPTFVTTSV